MQVLSDGDWRLVDWLGVDLDITLTRVYSIQFCTNKGEYKFLDDSGDIRVASNGSWEKVCQDTQSLSSRLDKLLCSCDAIGAGLYLTLIGVNKDSWQDVIEGNIYKVIFSKDAGVFVFNDELGNEQPATDYTWECQ